MSAQRSEDAVFSLRKPYQLTYSFYTHPHGESFQGESKLTARKDWHFHFAGTRNIHIQFRLRSFDQ